MRKAILIVVGIICLMGIMGGCGKKQEVKEEPHRMIEQITKDYHEGDEKFDRYGTYREVVRKYNYKYYFTTYICASRISRMRFVNCYVNEFGDTTLFIYTDYTNYPAGDCFGWNE